MIYRNLEFHNVIDLDAREHLPGLQLQRIARGVREQLNPRGRWNSQSAPGSEIRFVTTATELRLFISTLEGDGDLVVYRGDFVAGIFPIKSGGVHCIHVQPPDRFDAVSDAVLRRGRFAPEVWRFMTGGFYPVFHQLETFGHAVRPPTAAEKPRLRWLAYGSSITAGSGTTRPYLSYPQQAARRLGVDVLNMGMGGACMCEPELADFFATQIEWDFATVELGVNMRARFTPAEFESRARYLVNALRTAHPKKPVILITLFPNWNEDEQTPSLGGEHQRAFASILRTIAAEDASGKLSLIEGSDLMPDFDSLTVDLLHPSDSGGIQIGENLARCLAPLVPVHD